MRIQVTQKHINKGIKESMGGCPVALAIKKILKSQSVSVYGESLVCGGEYFYCPRSVKRFVELFDKKGKKAVRPFGFILREVS